MTEQEVKEIIAQIFGNDYCIAKEYKGCINVSCDDCRKERAEKILRGLK